MLIIKINTYFTFHVLASVIHLIFTYPYISETIYRKHSIDFALSTKYRIPLVAYITTSCHIVFHGFIMLRLYYRYQQVHSHVNLSSMLVTFKVGTLASFNPLSSTHFLSAGKCLPITYRHNLM